MKTKDKDFIEFDFYAKIKDGEIFDTTLNEVAIEAGITDKEDKQRFKPLKICIGEGMILKGLDKALFDKELNKEYSIELSPDESFGKRKANLIRTFPATAFKTRPYPGMLVNVEGTIAKVVSANSGRIMLDFNNPLSGKTVIYTFTINKIILDDKEKLELLFDGYGLKVKSISLEEKKAKIEMEEKYPKQILEEISKKIKELSNLDTEFI